MFNLIVTSKAEEDLNQTLNYYLEILKNPNAAISLIDEIEEKFNILKYNPYISEIENDEYLKTKSIRSVLVKNTLLFYTIDEDKNEVTILRILYARRNWIDILGK